MQYIAIDFIDFLLVFFIFIIPSLLKAPLQGLQNNVLNEQSFQVMQIIYYGVISAYLLWRSVYINSKSKLNNPINEIKKNKTIILITIIILFLLFFNGFFWNLIAKIVPQKEIINNFETILNIKYNDYANLIQIVIGIIIFAIYEESLFRQYLPAQLHNLTNYFCKFSQNSENETTTLKTSPQKNIWHKQKTRKIPNMQTTSKIQKNLNMQKTPKIQKYLNMQKIQPSQSISNMQKIIFFISELFVITVFALCHRYLGIWAVCNGFIGGFLLRFLVIKTGKIQTSCIVHALYNIVVYFYMQR